MRHIRSISAALAAAVIPIGVASAAAITAGNPVVMRVDYTGTQLFATGSTSRGGATWLDEYDAQTGNWVQSFPLPTGSGTGGADSTAFTIDFSAQDGVLSTTPDRSAIVFAGYRWKAQSIGTGNPLASTTPRAVGTLTKTGVLNTSFDAPVPGTLTGATRSATSVDGSTFYVGTGYGSGATAQGVLYYSTSGGAGTLINSRRVRTVGFGNLGGTGPTLVSTDGEGASNDRVLRYGTGTPPTSALAPTPIISPPGSIQGFAFADLNSSIAGDDTLYLIQAATTDPNGQGLQKWSYNGTSWSFVNTIASATALNLAAFQTSSGVNLFVTGSTGLFKITDTSGYGSALTGSLAQLTPGNAGLIPGGANNGTTILYRGVAVVPEPTSLAVLGFAGLLAGRRRSRR